METINIVFSCDDKYAMPTGVTICSIFENKKCKNKINIYILDGGISKQNKEKLNYLSLKYNFKIEYKKISPEIFSQIKMNGHLTIPSYYRILIPEILNHESKSLYLDCDMVIISDLYPLYSININDYFFAAVDEKDYNFKRLEKLEIPIEHKYFNSGMILFNMNKWRNEEIVKNVIKYAKENQDKFDLNDQDALNGYMHGKWMSVDSKYNYMTHFMSLSKTSNKDISIIHFTGIKPWNYMCMHPLKDQYFYYLEKTPWRDTKYINKNTKTVILKTSKEIIIKILPRKIYKIIKIYRENNYIKKQNEKRSKI